MKRDLTPEQLAQPINVTLPLGAVLRLAESEPRAAAAPAASIPNLPAIGEAWLDGIYAGITVHDNRPMVLVLLPGEEKKNWKDALAWAKKHDGELPSRFDALTLHQNLKGEFDKDSYYWTSEEYPGLADYAWIQFFGSGYQYGDHKSYACRCRAVRRVAI